MLRRLSPLPRRLACLLLEDRTVPSAYLVTGSDFGGGPHVRVYDTASGSLVKDLFPYDPNFRGGVRVASGDVTGDGIADIVTAAGTGGGPHVKIINGATFQDTRSFFAYESTLRDGVYTAVGDVDGDGFADVATGAGRGGGPRVTVFGGRDGRILSDFFAYDLSFTGGVYVALGDVNGDGFADLVTGTGVGGGAHVRVLDIVGSRELANFFAYDPRFTGGVLVATGDLDGDGLAEIITGTGPGGGPQVNVFTTTATGLGGIGEPISVGAFFAFDSNFRGGVRVAVSDVNGDLLPDIIASGGEGQQPLYRAFDSTDFALLREVQAYNPAFTGGVYIAGGGQIPQTLFRNALTDNAVDLGILTDAGLVATGRVSLTKPTATFRFGVSVEQTVAIGIDRLVADADLRLIRDLNGNGRVEFTEIRAESINGGTQADGFSTYLGPGTYFAQVRRFDGETTFELSIASKFTSDDLGAIDLGKLGSTPLQATGFVSSFIGDGIDIYTFSIPGDGTVTLELTAMRDDGDLYLLADYNEDGFPETTLAESLNFGADPEKIVADLTIGTYYVAVSPFYAQTSYRLTISTPGITPVPPPPPLGPPTPPVPLPPVGEPFELPPKNPANFKSRIGYGLVRADRAVSAALGRSLASVAISSSEALNAGDLNLIGVGAAWNAGITGQGIVVAVIDTGINFAHFELTGRIWTNPGEVPGNRIDDDGNGFIDDVRGWNFALGNNNPGDFDGHGSHIAGTIAGNRGNGGITGVAPGAQIMPLNVFARDRGDVTASDEAIAAAIDYASANGAHVISMSLGGGGLSALEQAALQRALARNVVVVIAAGNDGAAAPDNPARAANRFANIMAVGAVDRNNVLADFSNGALARPPILNFVVAPGVNVTSLTRSGNGFDVFSGTSMATPHVAGTAALVRQANPNLSAVEVVDLLSRAAVTQGVFVG